MDITSLQSTLDTLTAQEMSQAAALKDTQDQITVVKEQLNYATVVNALEALNADQVKALNETLAGDPQNTNGITVAGNFPQAGA